MNRTGKYNDTGHKENIEDEQSSAYNVTVERPIRKCCTGAVFCDLERGIINAHNSTPENSQVTIFKLLTSIMVTTRTQGMSLPDRTLLQLQRDLIASGMDFTWPGIGTRPNQDSRGIENGGGFLCYQSSVLQTFMHQPPFLRWIMTHDTKDTICEDTDCVKCYMKQLAEEYWGPQDPTDNPVRSKDDPASIANVSFNSGLFMDGGQEDAVLFYSWLLDQLHAQPPYVSLPGILLSLPTTDNPQQKPPPLHQALATRIRNSLPTRPAHHRHMQHMRLPTASPPRHRPLPQSRRPPRRQQHLPAPNQHLPRNRKRHTLPAVLPARRTPEQGPLEQRLPEKRTREQRPCTQHCCSPEDPFLHVSYPESRGENLAHAQLPPNPGPHRAPAKPHLTTALPSLRHRRARGRHGAVWALYRECAWAYARDVYVYLG